MLNLNCTVLSKIVVAENYLYFNSKVRANSINLEHAFKKIIKI
jgi:hypothetical protein